MFSLNIFFETLLGISQNKSLCRILQNFYSKKITVHGNVIEFGATPNSNKNFIHIMKKKKIERIFYSDNIKIKT